MIGNVVDLSKTDDGIIEVMRELLILGTKGIEEWVLLDNNFNFVEESSDILTRYFRGYGIAYKRRECPFEEKCNSYHPKSCTVVYDFIGFNKKNRRR